MALLMILTIASHSCEFDNNTQAKTCSHHLVSQEIEVSIIGEVESPGKFLVKRGSLIKELLLQAKLKPHADLRRIKEDGILKKGQCIKIPALNMITIILEFTDDTKHEMLVPKGTRLENLRDFYMFETYVDIEKLKKNRLLKDGEVIKVSLKNEAV